LPRAFEEVFARALHADPKARFSTAGAFAEALAEAQSKAPNEADATELMAPRIVPLIASPLVSRVATLPPAPPVLAPPSPIARPLLFGGAPVVPPQPSFPASDTEIATSSAATAVDPALPIANPTASRPRWPRIAVVAGALALGVVAIGLVTTRL